MAFLKQTTVNGDITSSGRLILNNSSAKLITNYIIAAGSGTAETNAFAVDTAGTVYLNNISSIGNTTIQSKTGAPFAVQAMSVSPSAEISLTNAMAKLNCNQVYDSTNANVSTPIFTATGGGIKVSRAGTYFILGHVYVSGVTAGDAVATALYVNDTGYAAHYKGLVKTYGGISMHPRVFKLNAGDIVYMAARNYTAARGSVTSTTRSILTVISLT